MFAQRAQDRPRLGVHSGKIVELAPKMNGAVGLDGAAEINSLAFAALQFGKEPRRRMGVAINVAASSLATAHTLPTVITSVRKTKGSRSGQYRSVEKRAV